MTFLIMAALGLLFSSLLKSILSMPSFAKLRGPESYKGYLLALVAMLVVTSFLEFTLFNFRHYESLFYKPIQVSNYVLGSGLQTTAAGKILVLEAGDKTLEVPNIQAELKNIYLNLFRASEDYVPITILVSDEGNENYYTLPQRDIFSQIKKSQFLRLHLYGKAKGIKVEIRAKAGEEIDLIALAFNTRVPLMISPQRILWVWGILFIAFLIRPRSPIYRYQFNPNSNTQLLLLISMALLQISFFWSVVNMNPDFKDPPWPHHNQYQSLTDALMAGQVHLLETPPEALATLSNPYDNSQRAALGISYNWDHAYYEGKYFVYFGIGPVLLLYLPYLLINGIHLATYKAVFFVSIFAVIGSIALMRTLAAKWFPRTPLVVMMVLTTIFINCSGILYMVKRPDHYNLTILMAVTFGILGLYFWLKATLQDHLPTASLFLGSLFMALIAACRPQLVLVAFFALVLFWDATFKSRLLFSKKGFFRTLLFVVPFFAVAALLMYYNFIRFNSVLDFGANYNLTTNDMTRRGWVFDRTWLGLYAYLLQPTGFQAIFPYVQVPWLHTHYQGTTIIENPIGGVLYNNLILLLVFCVAKLKTLHKDKKVYALALLSAGLALVILVADTQLAGILMRYLSDFSWLLFIPAILVALSITQRLKGPRYRLWLGALNICFYSSMSYQLLAIFIDVSDSILYTNPLLAQQVGYLIQFWL